jgi:6-phosphogluconolactonase
MVEKQPIILADDARHLARIGAERFTQTVRNRVETNGRCNIALSGGSTPRRLHRLLGQNPYADAIPWKNLHLFWVDERLVPVDDPASNYGLALKDFIQQVALPRENIHPMPVDPPPQSAAQRYRQVLEKHFGKETSGGPVFDLILLGVGTDGHTASIFPGDAAAENPGRWVVAVRGGIPDVQRLTLTYTVLNSAEQIAFLVSGPSKAPVVKRLLLETDASLPPLKISPKGGRIQWLLDRDAAGLLPPDDVRIERSS